MVSILFLGNSLTYGGERGLRQFRADTVKTLDGDPIGGIPAICTALAAQRGRTWSSSALCEGGAGLDWHCAKAHPPTLRRWDHVVLQGRSTHLDRERLRLQVAELADRFIRYNAGVRIWAVATWSRPDLIFNRNGIDRKHRWRGRSIYDLSEELRSALEHVYRYEIRISDVIRVGDAFNTALRAGLARYGAESVEASHQVDLWDEDRYHASAAGCYLSALMIYGRITRSDPLDFAKEDEVASALGVAPHAAALRRVASLTLRSNGGAVGED